MSVFSSLGSNYSVRQVLGSLLPAPMQATKNLCSQLKQEYKAEEIYLTYKCREAITLILRQLQLPEGSYVAVNGYTCYVVYAAVVAAGLKPYLIDISKDNLNFSADNLRQAIQKESQITAVIIQNTLGMPSPIDAIRELCLKQQLPLIEDLAHSAGLVYPGGEPAGTIGQAAAFSFSQDKIIDAVSGGAAVLFQKNSIEPDYHSVSMWHRLQAYGYPLNTFVVRKTHKLVIGKVWLKVLRFAKLLPNQMAGDPKYIRRLPNHQAKLAAQAIKTLPETIAHRQKIVAIYQKLLPKEIQFSHIEGSVYIRFPLLVNNPRMLEEQLKQQDVYIAQPWYDAVIAPKSYLALADYQLGQCPEAEYVAEHMVNLPTHINVNEAQAQLIAEKVNQWLSQ